MSGKCFACSEQMMCKKKLRILWVALHIRGHSLPSKGAADAPCQLFMLMIPGHEYP